MADISQYLANIMSAVYGEDVRGSIHDAIDIINQVSEVVLTAGTAVTGPTSSSTGFFEDSFYLNTNTNDLWKCIGTDAWTLVGNFEGNGIVSITKTSTSGLVDTYTVTYTKGSPTYFAVTNGKDGNKWYNGNSIYGKAVLPTVYASSGITYANSDDFYFNTTECAIYHCVTEGDPTVATWSYDFTITGGGHTIVDSSGTDEPQRGKLQFDGLNVDDDPVNDKTIVHGNIKVCQTEAAWLDLLENHPDQVNDPNVQWFLPWMSSERFATDRAPVGTVISITSQKSGDFTGATTPTGVYPPNSDYLVCDGVVKNITAYPQLANYFESAYGSKNYFGGDGTTTFALPDFSADFPDNGILCIKAQISSTIITEAEVDDSSTAADKVWSAQKVANRTQSNKIYRFDMDSQTVAANTKAVMTEGYKSDDTFYIANGIIYSRYNGPIQISTHIAGAPDNNNGRLWATIDGTGNEVNLLGYGAYLSVDNVQIVNANPTTFAYRVNFMEGFKIGSGGVGKGYVFITIL